MTSLTPTMRTAIRDIHDGNGDRVSGRTMTALSARNLVTISVLTGPALTVLGKSAYRDIMASGDGPEDLKEMFSFLTPHRRRR